MALVKVEGREQSCCLLLLEDWQCQVCFGRSNWERWLLIPPTFLVVFRGCQKLHLDICSFSRSLWSSVELSSGKDALKQGNAQPAKRLEKHPESGEQTCSHQLGEAGGKAAS